MLDEKKVPFSTYCLFLWHFGLFQPRVRIVAKHSWLKEPEMPLEKTMREKKSYFFFIKQIILLYCPADNKVARLQQTTNFASNYKLHLHIVAVIDLVSALVFYAVLGALLSSGYRPRPVKLLAQHKKLAC
jgi:hypothetical protein